MPRYYVHIHDGPKSTQDHEGHDYRDDAHARREAIKSLCDIAADEVPRDGDRRDISVHVTGENGHPLFSARIDFTVDEVAKGPPFE